MVVVTTGMGPPPTGCRLPPKTVPVVMAAASFDAACTERRSTVTRPPPPGTQANITLHAPTRGNAATALVAVPAHNTGYVKLAPNDNGPGGASLAGRHQGRSLRFSAGADLPDRTTNDPVYGGTLMSVDHTHPLSVRRGQ